MHTHSSRRLAFLKSMPRKKSIIRSSDTHKKTQGKRKRINNNKKSTTIIRRKCVCVHARKGDENGRKRREEKNKIFIHQKGSEIDLFFKCQITHIFDSILFGFVFFCRFSRSTLCLLFPFFHKKRTYTFIGQ